MKRRKPPREVSALIKDIRSMARGIDCKFVVDPKKLRDFIVASCPAAAKDAEAETEHIIVHWW